MPLAVAVYFAPFALAADRGIADRGLYMVFRENLQRFVSPANHRGPVYLYAYVIFGLVPFLQSVRQNPVDLRPLVVNDSGLSRMMVSVVVKPERFPQANAAGAAALQKFLLLPSTQARIKSYRFPGLDHALWWPRAVDTSTFNLGYEGGDLPAMIAGGIVNAASRNGSISPGTIVEIYGTNQRCLYC